MNAIDEEGDNPLFFVLVPFTEAVNNMQHLLNASKVPGAQTAQTSMNPNVIIAQRQSVSLASSPANIPTGPHSVPQLASQLQSLKISASIAPCSSLPPSFQSLRSKLHQMSEKQKLKPSPRSHPNLSQSPFLAMPNIPFSSPINFGEETLPSAVFVIAYLIQHGTIWQEKNKHSVFLFILTQTRRQHVEKRRNIS